MGKLSNLLRLLDIKPDEFYRLGFDKKTKAYKSFEIPKKQKGDFRQIHAPRKDLRLILSDLSKKINKQFEPMRSSHGFHPGRSIVSNAKLHYGKTWVLNIDLKDFFPSISEKRVFGAIHAWKSFCQSWGLGKKEAFLLARFCCHEQKLPQGAPTSPVLSNLVARHLDRDLQRFAFKNKFNYSRYADDITFSPYQNRSDWSKLVDEKEKESGSSSLILSPRLQKIIEKNDFQVNERKIRLQKINDSMEVTGLVVNQRVNVRRKMIRQTRAMLHAWEKYGIELADKEFRKKYETRERYGMEDEIYFDKIVLGKINFIGMVRGKGDPVYLKLRERIIKLEPKFGKSLSVNLEIATDRIDWNELRNEESKSKREVLVDESILSTASRKSLDEVVLLSGLAKTKRSAKNCISNGEIHVNGEAILAPKHRVRKEDKITVSRPSYLNLWVKSRVNHIVDFAGGIRQPYKNDYLLSFVCKAERDFLEKRGRWIENLEAWTKAWDKLASILGDEVGKAFNDLPANLDKTNKHLRTRLSEYYKDNNHREFYIPKGSVFKQLREGGGQQNRRGQGLAVLNLWVALADVRSDDPAVLRHAKRFEKAHLVEPKIGSIFCWLTENRNKTKRNDLSLKQKKQFREYFYRAWRAFGTKI